MIAVAESSTVLETRKIDSEKVALFVVWPKPDISPAPPALIVSTRPNALFEEGFTWEDAAHLYMRRARTDEVLFGKPAEHWDRLAEEAEIL